MLPIDNNNIRVIIHERKTTDTNKTLQKLSIFRSLLWTGITMMYFINVYEKFQNRNNGSQRKQEEEKGE